jgi:hypothetical protein
MFTFFLSAAMASLNGVLILSAIIFICTSTAGAAITSLDYDSGGDISSYRYTTSSIGVVGFVANIDADISDPTIYVNYVPVTTGNVCPAPSAFTCTGSATAVEGSLTCSSTIPTISSGDFAAMVGACKVILSPDNQPTGLWVGNVLRTPFADSISPSTTQLGPIVNLTVRVSLKSRLKPTELKFSHLFHWRRFLDRIFLALFTSPVRLHSC